MSIGPMFELPAAAVLRLPTIASSLGINLETVDVSEDRRFVGRYIFRKHLGRIEGLRRLTGDGCRVWLTFPRAHAFNPFMWMFDFRLTSRIEQMFQEVGGSRCDVYQFFDDQPPK
jgi:hypothetical protein